MLVNENIKVIELRNYLLKPDARDRFIEYFEKHFIESQNELGGHVLGEFRIKNEADRFFWIRGFESINSRSRFLPTFYGGTVWKEFGSAANEMMLEWHNVHLLKPLRYENINNSNPAKGQGIFVVDYYTSKDEQLEALANFFETEHIPFLKSLAVQNITLWVSEMSENDFLRLPVIKNKDLLVSITNFRDEPDYQDKSIQSVELKNALQKFIIGHESLILYPAMNL